jgi:ParB family chromosome partitioning protein
MSDVLKTWGTPMPIPIQKGRLGRGLASLIGETPEADARLPAHGEQRLLSLDQLHPSGHNPRKSFDDLELIDLTDSIRQKGLLQPIIARPDRTRGGCEIVAGERRWRAAQKASLHTVPVIVRELSDSEAAEFALIENVQRTDLNPIEEATGYQRLIEEYGYTQEALSARVGKDRSTIANALRLLRLPSPVRDLCTDGRLSMGHARALLGLESADAMERLARRVVSRDLSVRQVEALVRRERNGAAAARDLATRLSQALGTRVEVAEHGPGRGEIVVHYHSLDQLDALLDQLLTS